MQCALHLITHVNHMVFYFFDHTELWNCLYGVFMAVIYCIASLLLGIAVDGGNGICNGTCEDVPIALVKRQGRVAALFEEIEGWCDLFKCLPVCDAR